VAKEQGVVTIKSAKLDSLQVHDQAESARGKRGYAVKERR